MKTRTKGIYITCMLILIIIVTVLYVYIYREDSKLVYDGTFVRRGIQSVEDMMNYL